MALEQKNIEESALGVDKADALIILKKFEEFLNNGQKIPEKLPEEPGLFIGFKDVLSIFFSGAMLTAIVIAVNVYYELKAEITYEDVFGCAIFFWAIEGVCTYFVRKKEYYERKERIDKKRERMLNGEGLSKYQYEDELLNLINKSYKLYIGNPIFQSTSIRNQYKSLFQTELLNITKFAVENKMNNEKASEIIEKFYKNRHDCEIGEMQKRMAEMKEKTLELKSECEDSEFITDAAQSSKIIEEIKDYDAKIISMTSNDYEKALKAISEKIEAVEQNIKNAEDQRKMAIESFVTNIPKYQNEIIEISLIREKYPDSELSSSFIRDYERKMSEIKEKIDLPLESIEKRAFEIDSEIKRYIASLKDMIEEEYTARHKKIYGKVDNKLAHKFLKNYK